MFACGTGDTAAKRNNAMNSKLTSMPTTSPNSSVSSCSVDSGQCSGRISCLAQKSSQKQSTTMSDSAASSDFSTYLKSSLPSYARVAVCLDHVLRTASTIYSLLESNLDDNKVTRELVNKTQIYIQIVQQSACQTFLADEDFALVTTTMQQINNCQPDYKDQKYLESLDYASVVVRRMLEQSLIVFLRITTNYLNECTNKDRLLVIALEHLVHLLLFSDELCLEAIRYKAVDNIVTFCRQSSTSDETLKLLLRSLAVLCGVSRGCVQLIAIGGLELVIHLFSNCSTSCAVEAAGVLAQLTNPNHPFIRVAAAQVEHIIARLLELIDECQTPESLLLSTATLANFSLQNNAAVKMLYEQNAIQRLVQALSRPENSSNIFIQEQVVIIFSQLAACAYDQALVAQSAIPMLLRMLRAGELTQLRFDYAKRIRYKAAVCLATIATHSLGLKAIYENYGLEQLEAILKRENFNQSAGNSPFLLVCANISQQLKTIYKPSRTAV